MKKKQKKYITLGDGGGCDFRRMAKIMTTAGYKMNHATARNQLMLAVESLLMQFSSKLKIKLSAAKIKEMVGQQDVQDNLGDVLYLAHKELENEKTANNNNAGITAGGSNNLKATRRPRPRRGTRT